MAERDVQEVALNRQARRLQQKQQARQTPSETVLFDQAHGMFHQESDRLSAAFKRA